MSQRSWKDCGFSGPAELWTHGRVQVVKEGGRTRILQAGAELQDSAPGVPESDVQAAAIAAVVCAWLIQHRFVQIGLPERHRNPKLTGVFQAASLVVTVKDFETDIGVTVLSHRTLTPADIISQIQQRL
jgi:hypothetical protein